MALHPLGAGGEQYCISHKEKADAMLMCWDVLVTLGFLSGCLRPQGYQNVVFNPWSSSAPLIEPLFA